jgi:hypothetical protein
VTDETVALSVLSLDVTPPAAGWAGYLSDRGIKIVIDDVGRDAVSRSDARMLLSEDREQREAAEARRREIAERQERLAIEADRQFRARWGRGVPIPGSVLCRVVTSAAGAAATIPVPQPLAIHAPVTVDFANMTLVVRRPDAGGGSEKLLWRESHTALVQAEEAGWPPPARGLCGAAPQALISLLMRRLGRI